MKKYLIIGIILLIICFCLTGYYEIKRNNFINIYEITNKGLKEENRYVYLDATFLAGSISNDYYVFFGDGVQYIVYMNDSDANKINKYLLDNPDASYRIEGVTRIIPTDLEENGKEFVKKWLDNSHNHEEDDHSHEITTDDFYHYFGHVYLDSTVNIYPTIKIIIYLTGIVGSLLTIGFIVKKFQL